MWKQRLGAAVVGSVLTLLVLGAIDRGTEGTIGRANSFGAAIIRIVGGLISGALGFLGGVFNVAVAIAVLVAAALFLRKTYQWLKRHRTRQQEDTTTTPKGVEKKAAKASVEPTLKKTA
ncbi:MAG TPA: hypothetical protein VGA08_00215 [Candidatus Saccharimonadales bacterium]